MCVCVCVCVCACELMIDDSLHVNLAVGLL